MDLGTDATDNFTGASANPRTAIIDANFDDSVRDTIDALNTATETRISNLTNTFEDLTDTPADYPRRCV